MSTSFKLSKYWLIKRAFSYLNKFGVDEEVPAEDFNLASDMLNMMIKLWSDKAYNLWLKKTAYLFCTKAQSDYQITATTTDHFTLNYVATTVNTTAIVGATSIVLTSTTGMLAGDYIGIILDSNYIYWTTIQSIIGNTVNFTLGGAMPSQASAGNIVCAYTTPLDVPLDIYEAVRNDQLMNPSTDVPMNVLSYDEYIRLPNKTTAGIPVSYQYDRQLDNTIIRLWLVPDRSSFIIKLLIGQKVNNIDLNSDNVEFPDEWQLPIIQNLAVIMAPIYGKNKGDGFVNLVALAKESLNTALAFDNEVGSIYFKPNMHNA